MTLLTGLNRLLIIENRTPLKLANSFLFGFLYDATNELKGPIYRTSAPAQGSPSLNEGSPIDLYMFNESSQKVIFSECSLRIVQVQLIQPKSLHLLMRKVQRICRLNDSSQGLHLLMRKVQ